MLEKLRKNQEAQLRKQSTNEESQQHIQQVGEKEFVFRAGESPEKSSRKQSKPKNKKKKKSKNKK